jgi:hypothetical protein
LCCILVGQILPCSCSVTFTPLGVKVVYITTPYSLLGLYRVAWNVKDTTIVKDRERFWEKAVVTYFIKMSWHYKENYRTSAKI